MKFRIQALSSACVCALVLLASGCQSGAKPPRGYDNTGLKTGRLMEVNPTDIVVLPISNMTGKELPLGEMREQFQAGLVRLRYSPLSLDYVDQNRPVDASYIPGQLAEEAAFKVTITSWDDSRWETHSRLIIDAEVHILDAAVGESLWGGQVSRRVDVPMDIPGSALNRTLMARAVETFVGDVLASVPPRDPRR